MSSKGVYSDFAKLLKNVVAGLYDTNTGEIRECFDNVAMRVEIKGKALVVLKKIVQMVMNTDFVSKETKLYISLPTLSYGDIADMIKKEEGAVKAKVWKDMQKIKELIGENTLKRIIYYDDEEVIERCSASINEYTADNKEDTILDGFIIDLKEKEWKEVTGKEVTEEEFKEALELLNPYTLGYAELIKRTLGEKMINYINSLAYNEEVLEKEDKERLNRIRSIIG